MPQTTLGIAPSRAHEMLDTLLAEQCVTEPPKVDKPLVLYGAGNLGRLAKEYLTRVGIPVSFVVDQNPEPSMNDPFWSGIDIVAPGNVSLDRKKSSILAVSVCTILYSDLHQALLAQGWEDIAPFYDIAQRFRSVHPLNNGWYTGSVQAEDISGIKEVMSGWNDDISRAHHLQFIAWHSLRQDWVFEGAPVTTQGRYFIPEVMSVLHDDEMFLDIGGHNGEVMLRFLELVGTKFREAWILEPDSRNRLRMEAEIVAGSSSEFLGKIKILPFAAGEANGRQAFFEGIGYASQISEIGNTTVDVKRIDELDLSPTFIKIHVEGHELTVLRGAHETIEKHRPIIAATSYHNHLGLWELPLWLMDKLSDYVFLLRLHSWCGTGAVIYAIPKERMH